VSPGAVRRAISGPISLSEIVAAWIGKGTCATMLEAAGSGDLSAAALKQANRRSELVAPPVSGCRGFLVDHREVLAWARAGSTTPAWWSRTPSSRRTRWSRLRNSASLALIIHADRSLA